MPSIWLSFESHAPDGHVWAIREGNKWHQAKSVDVQIPLTTVYRGSRGPQPKAYLKGQGRVTVDAGVAVIAHA